VIGRYPDPGKHQRWLAINANYLKHEEELRESLGDVAEEFLAEARDAPRRWGIPGRMASSSSFSAPGNPAELVLDPLGLRLSESSGQPVEDQQSRQPCLPWRIVGS
jgi:hypothetical protein